MTKTSYKEIAVAVLVVIESGKPQRQIASDVAQYLATERCSRDLDRIMREVERLRYERDGILEVVSTSARDLSERSKQEIKQMFDAKKVKIIERRDTNLVGGVKLQALDKQLDLSVRGQLKRLKNTNLVKG